MSGRPGFALLVSLLLVMALAAVGLGVTAIGVRERWIADAAQRHRQARALAEAAALDVVARWSTAAVATLEPGDELDVPGGIPGASVAIVRLDSTLLAVRSTWTEPREGVPPATAHAALLVRTVRPGPVAAAFPAAAIADGRAELHGGTVSGADPCGPPVAGVRAPEIVDPGLAVVSGSPPRVAAPTPVGAATRVLAPDVAPALATTMAPATVVTPGPGPADGTCRPESWGAIEPAHPCHDRSPLIHSAGPLVLSGGTARAILVVEGDLRLERGVRFEGLILVRGTLEIDDGSQIDGAVRAGTLVLRSGAIRRSRCTVLDVLSGPALDRAFRPAERWWVPAF